LEYFWPIVIGQFDIWQIVAAQKNVPCPWRFLRPFAELISASGAQGRCPGPSLGCHPRWRPSSGCW